MRGAFIACVGISSLFGTFFETLWKKCARLEQPSSEVMPQSL
jgi:hypothetical protein